VEIELYLKNEYSTQNLGHAIADSIPHNYVGLIVSLIGEMGAGKTTLVRSLLRSLGHKGNVPSPTYTLIEPYEFESGKIFHIDLYRINDQSELEFLGWNDLFEDGMIIVEWPQRAPIVKNRSDIEFVFDFIETGRNIKIKSLSSNGESFLKVLKKKIQH
tara:strand:- start:418 stop:894 length:477 start_codon:yes stop_codon:yes gene_type:complete